MSENRLAREPILKKDGTQRFTEDMYTFERDEPLQIEGIHVLSERYR